MNNVIYKIEIQGCDRFYIGSAINLHKRKIHHLFQLRNKSHGNHHLQKIYDKYGEDKFSFIVLEQVQNKEILLEAEQKWIDSFDFTKLINICPIAGNTLGRTHSEYTKKKISDNHHDVSGENNPMFGKKAELSPSFGKKRSNETKLKISQALKGKNSWCKGVKRPEHSEKLKGEKNSFYGKHHTEDNKQKISEGRKNALKEKGGPKLNIDIVRQIRNQYNSEKISISKLAKQHGLSRNYCSQLLKGVYWKDDEY